MRIFQTTILIVIFLIGFAGAAHAFGDPTIPNDFRGDGVVTLFRPVKNARETFHYRNLTGKYDEAVMEEIAYFFRCRLTDEVHPIDPYLIEIIDAIEDHFKGKEVRLISAFRSSLRNNIMRSGGRRVAKKSLHTEGKAADIEIQGVSTVALRNFAYVLKQGGIGYYRGRSFVHIDTGPLRTWVGSPHRHPA